MIQLYQTLDLRPIGIPQTLRLSQYDSDFEIIFELTNFDGAWILDTDTTAEVQGTKTDGHGYSADAVFDDQLKTVTIAGDVQMTAAAGRNTFEVVLFHDGDRLGSKNFILDVERAALDAETTASDSKIKNFTEMTEAATQAAATATEAAEAAEEAAATFTTDPTLSIPGKAADAEAVGEALAGMDSGLSDEAKDALLTCFRNVAWVNDQGQTYYDALEAALYPNAYPKIVAAFNPGLNIIYTDDSLTVLKQYLTVTYYETAESVGSIVASEDYALSGVLTEGNSQIYVSYDGLNTSFTVRGVVDFYNIWTWRYPSDNRVLLLDQKSPSIYNPTGQYSTLGIYEYSDSIRMMGAVNRGILPYMHRQEVVFYDGLYPIPIPQDATSVTISAVPSALQISATVSRYIESENRYEQILNNPGGWQTQPKTFTFDAAQNLFLSMSFRNASNTAMPDNEKPTAYTIEFA